MMCLTCCQREAPSTSLARNRGSGIARMALAKMIMPMEAPTNPLMRTTKTQALSGVSSIQLREATPNQPSTVLGNPVSQASHFQSSTYSTGGVVRGRNQMPRKSAASAAGR